MAARPSVDPALATMAELDRQIAARAAELETEAGGDRVKYLRLLRTDGALDCLKLEHDIHRELDLRHAPELQKTVPAYIDDAYLKRHGLDDASLKAAAMAAGELRPRHFPRFTGDASPPVSPAR